LRNSDENLRPPKKRSFKLLLDEDSSRKTTYNGLQDEGYDVITVSTAGLAGSNDEVVLQFAISEERALLTNNHRDFFRLHKSNPEHYGILATFIGTGHSSSLPSSGVVKAVNNLDAAVSSGAEVVGQYISLCTYSYDVSFEATSDSEES